MRGKRDKKPRTKLAAISVGEGREAAISRREDGSAYWTSGEDRLWQKVGDEADPVLLPVPDGTLVVGDLRPGAVEVVLRSPVAPRDYAVAGGVFIALLPYSASKHEVFAVHRDERGAIVPWRPDLEELKRTPLKAATAACPACGHRRWENVEYRAWPDAGHARLRRLMCAKCGRPARSGYEEAGRRRRPEPEMPAAWDSFQGLSPAQVVAAAEFGVYGPVVAGWRAPELHSYGWHDDGMTSVTLGVRRRKRDRDLGVTVRTERQTDSRHEPTLDERTRTALEYEVEVDEAMGAERNFDADQLREDELMRPIRAAIDRAIPAPLHLRVDGDDEVEFATLSYGDHTVAIAEIGDEVVTVTTRDLPLDDVELVRIADPDSYFSTGKKAASA